MLKEHIKMRLALVALAMLVATGCQQQPQQPQQASGTIAKEQSGMRTAVPLVRRLDPNETGTIELEFDVPAQPDDDAPPVFIGVRVAGNDPTAVSDVADRLRGADISAEVHLYRLQPSGKTDVALERSQWVGRSEVKSVALSADGLAPGLFDMDADFGSMQAAGLLSAGAMYRELAFAYAPDLPLGRYRAVIRVGQNRQVLLDADSELLIAYARKGK